MQTIRPFALGQEVFFVIRLGGNHGTSELHGKHLLGLQHATPEEIKLILDVAKKMKRLFCLMTKKIPYLKGKAIINLFMEPSTRTRSSFELAGKYLGADVINITPRWFLYG